MFDFLEEGCFMMGLAIGAGIGVVVLIGWGIVQLVRMLAGG